MTNELHHYLAAMAEEVIPVDLRDRVLVSSRRATVRRRVIVASSAAVAVVAIASGVAWAGQPGPRNTDVVPAVSGSPTPAPTTPSASPPSTRTSPPAPPRSDPPGPAVPDRLIYLDQKELQRLNADGTTDPLFEARTDSCGLVVSPDRGHIAYVVSDGGGATGDLIVGRGLTGESPKTILRNVSCMGGTSPVWAGRSGKLIVKQGNAGRRVTVDMTGRIGPTPFTNVEGYLAFSLNGQHVAYRNQDGQIVVAGPDGALERSFDHKDESPTGGFSVQGVSDDGKRVVVGLRNTDPDIVRTGFQLVDAQTGRDIDLPAAVTGPDRKAADITFMSGSDLLLRANGKLHRLTRDGADIIDTRTEPAGLSGAQLLGWY